MVAAKEHSGTKLDQIILGSGETLAQYLRREVNWEAIGRYIQSMRLLEDANRSYNAGRDSRQERRAARDREILAYREAGLKLIEAAELVAADNGGRSYGKWLPYLREYAPDIQPRQAQRLQELARVEYDVNSGDTSFLIAEWRRISGNAARTGATVQSNSDETEVAPELRLHPEASTARAKPGSASDVEKELSKDPNQYTQTFRLLLTAEKFSQLKEMVELLAKKSGGTTHDEIYRAVEERFKRVRKAGTQGELANV